jgi:hypothetical protein
VGVGVGGASDGLGVGVGVQNGGHALLALCVAVAVGEGVGVGGMSEAVGVGEGVTDEGEEVTPPEAVGDALARKPGTPKPEPVHAAVASSATAQRSPQTRTVIEQPSSLGSVLRAGFLARGQAPGQS